jgi:glycosyltransferase involved in cell wall biosynthesis
MANRSVRFYFRHPTNYSRSIEELFSTVINYCNAKFDCEIYRCEYGSGVLGRLKDIVKVGRLPRMINHITGDVHYLAFFLHKKDTILTIHDCNFVSRKISRLRKVVIKWFWYIIPVHRSKVITTISEFSKKQIIEITHCKENRIVVIPDCYSPIFSFIPKDMRKDCPQLLQVGTGWNKNLERVIEAVKGTNWQLNIIGELSQEQRNALSEGGITYSNYRNLSMEQVRDTYVQSDIVVFVSLYEGFGLPIVEAQAVGRPVVTSSIEPMIDVSGGSAALVNPYSSVDIHNAIQRIIEDDSYRNELIRRGFENSNKYSIDVIGGKYEELYNSFL